MGFRQELPMESVHDRCSGNERDPRHMAIISEGKNSYSLKTHVKDIDISQIKVESSFHVGDASTNDVHVSYWV